VVVLHCIALELQLSSAYDTSDALCLPFILFPLNIQYLQADSFVLWQPSDCADIFVIYDITFVLYTVSGKKTAP